VPRPLAKPIAETAERDRRRSGLAAEARSLMHDPAYVAEAREVAGSWSNCVVRGDVYAIKMPRGRGRVQYGRRYAVIVQADDLLTLSTVVICPTSTSAPAASFHPEIELGGERTKVLCGMVGACGCSQSRRASRPSELQRAANRQRQARARARHQLAPIEKRQRSLPLRSLCGSADEPVQMRPPGWRRGQRLVSETGPVG